MLYSQITVEYDIITSTEFYKVLEKWNNSTLAISHLDVADAFWMTGNWAHVPDGSSKEGYSVKAFNLKGNRK